MAQFIKMDSKKISRGLKKGHLQRKVKITSIDLNAKFKGF